MKTFHHRSYLVWLLLGLFTFASGFGAAPSCADAGATSAANKGISRGMTKRMAGKINCPAKWVASARRRTEQQIRSPVNRHPPAVTFSRHAVRGWLIAAGVSVPACAILPLASSFLNLP